MGASTRNTKLDHACNTQVLLKFSMLKNGNVDISAHCGPRSEKFPSILGDKQRFENEEVNRRVLEARQVRVCSYFLPYSTSLTLEMM